MIVTVLDGCVAVASGVWVGVDDGVLAGSGVDVAVNEEVGEAVAVSVEVGLGEDASVG